MGNANHGDLLDGRMFEQQAFDFHRGNVFTATDNDVLEAIADLDVAIGVNHGGVPGMHPAAAQSFGGGGGIVEIALHDDVAARDDLSERLAVARDLAAFGVDHAQFSGRDQLDALTGFDFGALG